MVGLLDYYEVEGGGEGRGEWMNDWIYVWVNFI